MTSVRIGWAKIDALREHYGGPMSELEIAFLEDIKTLVDFTIHNELSFIVVVFALKHDNKIIVDHGFSLEKALSDGFKSDAVYVVKQNPDALKKKYRTQMTEPEVEFLRDIQGIIDFAVHNGLSFTVVLIAIGHDINHIIDCGLSLDSNVFLPQVSGYAQYANEPLIDPDTFSESG